MKQKQDNISLNVQTLVLLSFGGSLYCAETARAQMFLCTVIFGGFWVHTSTWALINRRKLLNPPKIALFGNCRSSASIRATNVPKVPFE